MCTQPVDSGTSTRSQLSPRSVLTPPAAMSWLPVQRAPGQERQRKSGSIQAPSSRSDHLRRARSCPWADRASAARRSARRPPSAQSGRKRTTHSSWRPPGWAVWNRPVAPVAGSVKITGFCSERSGRPRPGRRRSRRRRPGASVARWMKMSEPALQRAAEPGTGQRAIRQPLQEGRVIVDDRRRQERLRPAGRRPAQFVRSCAPRSRPGSSVPPPIANVASQ